MSAASNTPASKGMRLVAAYRAERLNQRPALRTGLQKSHLARRMARFGNEDDADPVAVEEVEAPAPVLVASAPGWSDHTSVFANLVSTDVAERQTADDLLPGAFPAGDAAAVDVPVEDAAEPDVAEELRVPPPDVPDVTDPMPSATSAKTGYDPPLAEIGFGPGMLIRLSQLGFYTTGDLALADAIQLREALGDISRLVDVEAWIANAQQTAVAASPGRQAA